MTMHVPATLRIKDGRLAKATVLVVRSHAFQLTTEEDWAEPEVVVGMYLLFSNLYLLHLLCVDCACIGTFLVNGMSAHVLFNFGAT